MAKRALSFYKFLLGVLMAFLGFASCSKTEEIVAAYGTPNAHLIVDVKVVDQANNPVKDAKLVVRSSQTYTTFFVHRDTIIKGQPAYVDTTNAAGRLFGYTNSFVEPEKEHTYIVYRSNLNPQLSGKYANDSVKVEPTVIENGDGGWYYGKFKLVGTLKLKEK